jgi:YidC/Oxa1 family membrane protein insertase
MEERRLLVATALCFALFSLYPFIAPQRPVVRPTPVPASSPSRPAVAPEAAPAAPAAPASTAASAVTPVADDTERRVEIQTQDVTAAFTNRGARLVSWTLHQYLDGRGKPAEMVQASAGGVRPLDLETARPLDLETGDPRVDVRLREALFRPSVTDLKIGPAGGEVVFEFAGDGMEAQKRLRFSERGYLVEVEAQVKQAGRPLPVKLIWGPGVGNPTAEEKDVRGYQPPSAAFLGGSGVERLPAEKLEAPRGVAEARWLGVEGKYFTALFVPGPGSVGEARSIKGAGEAKGGAAVALALSGPVSLYVGPKDHQILSRLGHGLEQVVPVGEWIGFIVVGFMRILGWLRGQVGSYGLAIICLTVIINLVMAPLRHYSIANGVRMAKLAPEMKVIQERYKKYPALDPRRQEMQTEMAALYARHGMSMGTQMAVGCVPLLLTFPFLIAMYRVLEVSIDLRGAHFLWMPDLSQKDPLFITPIIMGISMFLMQRMTPTAMDPAQQRVMMIMPLMLMVMFFAAPAGMNLYWVSSNLCSILQQGVTLRILKREDGARQRAKV